jgi:hypothetical protein
MPSDQILRGHISLKRIQPAGLIALKQGIRKL